MLPDKEPTLSVGLMENDGDIHGVFGGEYCVHPGRCFAGGFHVRVEAGILVMLDALGSEISRGSEFVCTPVRNSAFILRDVKVGVKFHWERRENQSFHGVLRLVADGRERIIAINNIPLEAYLKSVISSEMNGDSPEEFLKAHAITSRSWLLAMLHRSRNNIQSLPTARPSHEDLILWHTREDHDLYDVCADDHCQRYQGITRPISAAAEHAVESTRGVFLVHRGEICDARYHKACGGRTEEFRTAWEDVSIPYLRSVADSAEEWSPPPGSEADVRDWVMSPPRVFCNTTDVRLLEQILPAQDQSTRDFFRWKVSYDKEELEDLIAQKSGMDCGSLLDLIPVERGLSGRLLRLKIAGTKRSVVVGKELEIRRWLSPTHLYSSAFVVDVERTSKGDARRFHLHGAGWGHGVGLCQIGAAVMATNGADAGSILRHYFQGAGLETLYA